MKLTDAEKCANLGTIKIKKKVDEQREYIRNEITESCRWWKTVWSSLWNGFVRRQVKEVRVAEAVIPAFKDKSIERDFRTLKRDRLVADIPMWDSCFFCSKGSDRQGRCRLRIAAGNDSRLSE